MKHVVVTVVAIHMCLIGNVEAQCITKPDGRQECIYYTESKIHVYKPISENSSISSSAIKGLEEAQRSAERALANLNSEQNKTVAPGVNSTGGRMIYIAPSENSHLSSDFNVYTPESHSPAPSISSNNRALGFAEWSRSNIDAALSNSLESSSRAESPRYKKKYRSSSNKSNIQDNVSNLSTNEFIDVSGGIEIIPQSVNDISGATGLLGMQIMYSQSEGKPLYWFKAGKGKWHSQEQINYFENLPEVMFAQFGRVKRFKAKGTTNCVISVAESIYRMYGGKNGRINGVRITNPMFNKFLPMFMKSTREWVDALEIFSMGREVKNLQNIRIGDIAQTGGHRFFVAGRIYDKKGKLAHVIMLEASPAGRTKDNWKNVNAIKSYRKVPVKIIKNAARLFDFSAPSQHVGSNQNYNINNTSPISRVSYNFGNNSGLIKTSTHIGEYDKTYHKRNTADLLYAFSANLALIEFSKKWGLRLVGLPSEHLKTVGYLRQMDESYSNEYADLYLLWFYGGVRKSDYGAIAPPAINPAPREPNFANQEKRLILSLNALHELMLDKKYGLDVFVNYSHRVASAKKNYMSGKYRTYAESLHESIYDEYHVNINMNSLRHKFHNIFDGVYYLNFSKQAIEEFASEYSVKLKGFPTSYLLTIGMLRTMEDRYAKKYALEYIYWFYEGFKREDEGAVAPPIMDKIPGNEGYLSQIERLKKDIEVAHYLRNTYGDNIFSTYSKVVSNAIGLFKNNDNYMNYEDALRVSVYNNYNNNFNFSVIKKNLQDSTDLISQWERWHIGL